MRIVPPRCAGIVIYFSIFFSFFFIIKIEDIYRKRGGTKRFFRDTIALMSESLLELQARVRREQRAIRLQLRQHIAEHWEERSDAEIAREFGVPEINVRKLRQRMGLKKSDALQREIQNRIGPVSGWKRAPRR